MSADCGKAFRLGRIFDQKSHKAVCVAFDHGLDVFTVPGSGVACTPWPTGRGSYLRNGSVPK